MKDDPVLTALGEAEREAQAIPRRWLALVEGRADAALIARLREEAARDPDAALLWERFRPLDRGEEDAIAQAVIAKRRTSWRGAALLAAAAAIAAAWIFVPRAAVPDYQLEASPADRSIRGKVESSDAINDPQSALWLTLRPSVRAVPPIAVDAFVARGEQVERWDAPFEISPTGAARLDGTIAELLPDIRGEVTLLFHVRAANAPPLSPDAAREQWKARSPKIHVHALHVRDSR